MGYDKYLNEPLDDKFWLAIMKIKLAIMKSGLAIMKLRLAIMKIKAAIVGFCAIHSIGR